MDNNSSSDKQNDYFRWLLSFASENKLSFFLILVGFFACLMGFFILLNLNNLQDKGIEIVSDESRESDPNRQKKIFVEVSGEVVKPGVYEMPANARVFEILEKAGGLTEDADKLFVDKTVNKAARLIDGQKIFIPRVVDNHSTVLSARDLNSAGENQNVSSYLININTDSFQKLDSLPGIGQTYAQRIIDHRPYSSIEDLKNKKVIPNSLFEKIKDKITVY